MEKSGYDILLDSLLEQDDEIDDNSLTKQERFDIIRSSYVNKEVWNYLSEILKNIKVEILGDYEGTVLELMKKGHLEGWCWETTETSILFFNDNDYIERGNLIFEKNKRYYHSWICFQFNNEEYAFDPCLDFLCKKSMYSKTFETEVMGKVNAKQVKNYFIDYITNPPKKEMTPEEEERYERINKMFLRMFGEAALERQKDEVVIHDKEDVNAPMYRNGVGYKAEIEQGKVKKLTAHYYMNG